VLWNHVAIPNVQCATTKRQSRCLNTVALTTIQLSSHDCVDIQSRCLNTVAMSTIQLCHISMRWNTVRDVLKYSSILSHHYAWSTVVMPKPQSRCLHTVRITNMVWTTVAIPTIQCAMSENTVLAHICAGLAVAMPKRQPR
jgi:hypothetical protein